MADASPPVAGVPLPVAPPVDGRTFEQVLDEARKRIPLYTPDWTDYNPSDPGMTLLDLFAWLAQTTIWEIDQAPERSFGRFLDFLGVPRLAPVPARADVTFIPRPATARPAAPGPEATAPEVPARTRVAAAPADDGDTLLFETETGLELLSAELIMVEAGSDRRDVSANNAVLDSSYAPFGSRGQLGDALVLSFHGLAKDAGFAVPARLRLKVFMAPASADFSPWAAPDLRLEWAWCVVPAETKDGEAWRPAESFDDTTKNFTRDGYVVLGLPPLAVPVNNQLRLRCRIAAGGYGQNRAPQIDAIRANTVPAINLATVEEEGLGESNALARQYFFLKRQPVDAGSLILEVRPPLTAAAPSAASPPSAGPPAPVWRREPDFLAADRGDTVYTLDPATGRIDFGDGRRGRIPPKGAEIVARLYRWGGGQRGNVPAGAITQIVSHLPGAVGVGNERAASGGRDGETAAELRERAPRILRTRDRAVSADDYAALALEAGNVLEATTLPLRNPAYPGRAIPGCASLVIVAGGPLGNAVQPVQPPPTPPQALIRQVEDYLETRRIVTSELFVIAPSWRMVEARLRVIALGDAVEGDVRKDCTRAVNAFLIPRLATPPAPLRFGRGFYPYEVMAAVSRAAGVRAVLELSLTVDGEPHGDMTRPVTVPADGLLWCGKHTIEVAREAIP